MEWVETIAEDELAEGERKVVRANGRSILMIREDGRIYALESACPHMRLPLKGAKIEGHALTCPWHHSQFDLRTGDVQEWSPWPPAVGRMLGALSREKALEIYPTRIEGTKIWVGIAAPAF